MASFLKTFCLLLSKNYLLQIRRPWITVFEIILPVICCALLVIVRLLVDPKIYNEVTQFSPIRPDEFSIDCEYFEKTGFCEDYQPENQKNDVYKNKSFKTQKEFQSRTNGKSNKLKNASIFIIIPEVLYSPRNKIIDEIMLRLEDEIFLFSKVTAVNDSQNLENELISSNYIVGIEFADEYLNATLIPSAFKYKLRFPGEIRSSKSINIVIDNWKTTNLFLPFPLTSPRTLGDDDGSPGYYAEGFLRFQSLIFEAFVGSIDERFVEKVPKIFMQKFPYPPSSRDDFQHVIDFLVPLFMLLIFIFPCVNIVKSVLVEKEKNLTRLMKIMGIKSYINWISWFVKSFIYTFVIGMVFILFIKIKWFRSEVAIIDRASTTLLIVFVSIYSLTTVTFAFMILTFCKKSGIAISLASFSFMFQIIPYFANCNDSFYNELSRDKKILLAFIPNTAMALAMRCIAMRETLDGIQWENMFENFSDNISFGEMMIMLFLDGIIFLAIIFITNFLRKSKSFKKVQKIKDQPVTCVKIENLTKIYSTSAKPAVENLNLALNEHQITVLLGVNGAGKSTTMSMLCGEIKSTSGSVYIDEVKITINNRSYYNSTGICFQQNVLFNNLTVYEHLMFFGVLKGNSSSDADLEAQKFLKVLNLQANDLACSLSGGMKRKLCMAIALCSNSKLVILDEITSGIDPTSRRQIWNYLKEAKQNRIILMSTHFMLEAEVVADKIAILCDGKLKAFGTPFDLKQKFSKAYNLSCVKKSFCESRNVVEFLRKFIPSLTVLNETDMEIHLRFEKRNKLQTNKILEILEENMDELKLENFGVSSTLMDEVIEKVDDNLKVPSSTKLIGDQDDFNERIQNETSYSVTKSTIGRFSHFLMQLNALSNKKLITIRRNFNLCLLQIILPVILVSFQIIITQHPKPYDMQGEINLSIGIYSSTKVFMELGSDVKQDSMQFKIYQAYKKMLEAHKDVEIFETFGGIQEAFLKNSKKNIDLNFRNLYGISVNAENITGWFNNQPYHTLPIALNLVHNACLKAFFGENFEIDVGNKPLPYRAESKALFVPLSQISVNYQISIVISFAMSVSLATFVISIIKERLGNAKSMQFIVGISPSTYWITTFIWDFLIILIISAAVTVSYELFQNQEFSSQQEFWFISGLITILGLSVLPITYVCSFLFGSSASGFVFLIMIFIFSGPSTFIATAVFDPWILNLPDIKAFLSQFLNLFPLFNFCDAMIKIIEMNDIRKACDIQCDYFDICDRAEQCENLELCCGKLNFWALAVLLCFPETNLLSWSQRGIAWNITRFIIISFLALYLLCIIESKKLQSLLNFTKYLMAKVLRKFPKVSTTINFGTDLTSNNLDVKAEATKIRNMLENDCKNYNLVLKGLTKSFPSKQAVKDLSIAVKPGECFGLLGFNGAGKTTTFRMLIGDIPATSGDIFIKGLNIKAYLKEVHKFIGYCGQYDALIDELTSRETLTFYAQCHGIRSAKISSLINQLSTAFDFTKQLDKQVRYLSGGNKRKLSTAIALIGDPQILLLDEPTSFMDPIVKKKFLKQIGKLRDCGTTIILSSHSIEEIETLCDRIGIMMNGELKCLGSPQYLKNKFEKMITISLKVKRCESIEGCKNEVKQFIETELTGVQLKEEFDDMLIFHLVSKSHKWSKILKVVETTKEVMNKVDDFSISESNLLQVFQQISNIVA